LLCENDISLRGDDVSVGHGDAAFRSLCSNEIVSTKETDFTLTVDQRVHFSHVDDKVLDNRGGVSVRIEYPPEPAIFSTHASGAVLLALLSPRRSKRAVTMRTASPQ
jgi:hypothetical protein